VDKKKLKKLPSRTVKGSVDCKKLRGRSWDVLQNRLSGVNPSLVSSILTRPRHSKIKASRIYRREAFSLSIFL
jgi:hypothetical protein